MSSSKQHFDAGLPIFQVIHTFLKMAKSLKFIIRNCVIYITLSGVLHLQNFRIWSLADTKSVCKTAECQRLADYYKKSMHTGVAPCTNFYDYVCSNWIRHNPRPPHEEMWDLERSMEFRILKVLRRYLEDKTVSKLSDVEDAKKLYKMCMNLPSLEKSNAEKIKNIMKKIGKWPTFYSERKESAPDYSWWQIDNYYQTISGESALFGYNLRADIRKNAVMTQLIPLNSPYGLFKRIIDWPSSKEINHYNAFLHKVIKNVAPSNPLHFKKQIKEDVEKVTTFRNKLRKVIKEESPESFQVMTIAEFQKWYDDLAESRTTTVVNWLPKIRSIYGDPYSNMVDKTSEVYVPTKYLTKLVRLLAMTPMRVIVNHIHLYFAERHLILDADMEADVKGSICTDVCPSGRIIHKLPRWQWCIETNNLREGLKKMYIKELFPNNEKAAVQNLVENAKNVLGQEISESNWVDAETKRMSLTKIKGLETVVGYPRWMMLKFSVNPERDPYDIDPLNADLYFQQVHNRLSISAGYLQMPIYSPNLPYVIDYGSTVAVLSHELYHAFDYMGITYDEDGDHPWWSREMYDQFEKQAKCFKDFYGERRDEERKKLGVPNIALRSTANEDLADVMGLKLAYKGYRKKLQEKKGVCPVLPGFENFSCEKMFFIAFANTLCSNVTRHGNQVIMIGDAHNLPWVRVNGAVANMPEFSEAFGCTSEDPLKLHETCDIWKK